MTKRFRYFWVILFALITTVLWSQKNSINASRDVAVKVTNSSKRGTQACGFVLNDSIIATSLDAVGSIFKFEGVTHFTLYRDFEVIFQNGDTVGAQCITVPTNEDLAPIKYNFALLKLDSNYTTAQTPARIYSRYAANPVGENLFFSGYRDTSLILSTQTGMLSGFAEDSKFVTFQGPHNSFLNGTALMNSSGEVIGMISTRFNPLQQSLGKQLSKLEDETIQGDESTQQVFKTLKTFNRSLEINLGYAININYLRSYLLERGIEFRE